MNGLPGRSERLSCRLPGMAHSGGHTGHEVPPAMGRYLQVRGCDLQDNVKWQDQEDSIAKWVRQILAPGHVRSQFTSVPQLLHLSD